MSALATARCAEAFTRTTFAAWKLGSTGTSYPLDTGAADTLDAVVAHAAPRCHHKDIFHVLERDELAKQGRLHIYVIKQGKPVWQRKEGFAHPVQVKPLRAELIASMAVDTFVPIEPFRWSPGCDPVGLSEAQRNTVEAN